MPPKVLTLQPKSQLPDRKELEAIQQYTAQKPDFDQLLRESRASPRPASKLETSEYDRALNRAVADLLPK